MGKRLTEQEKRDREINRIISKISKLEKVHEKELVESACARYKRTQVERRKAQEEFEQAERKLQELKKRLK
ncbi:hypothetical protein [Lutibacter sp.]|uniref:hypothetical protein n=1 Tax=Lutibacter sp. TaxID=1925666 RepID=UPI0034A038E8